MSTPSDRTITFRSELKGALDDFLNDEGFVCSETNSALARVVAELSHYTEEGMPLFPEIYLCGDIETLVSQLPGSRHILIGCGPRTEGTALTGLKKCAYLAQGGWAMYLERRDDGFRYGVFLGSTLPLAMTPFEALVEAEVEMMPVVAVGRLAEKCVELRGCRGNRLCVHFSAAKEQGSSPVAAIGELADAMTQDVESELREPVRRFVYASVSKILQESHGALAAVVSRRRRTFPKEIQDAVLLQEAISLAGPVSAYIAHKDNEAMAALQSLSSLLRGAFDSDGIVVLRSDASLLGYRAFLRLHSCYSDAGGGPGGARLRAYARLKELVDKKRLRGAFFRSQDGSADFYGGLP